MAADPPEKAQDLAGAIDAIGRAFRRSMYVLAVVILALGITVFVQYVRFENEVSERVIEGCNGRRSNALGINVLVETVGRFGEKGIAEDVQTGDKSPEEADRDRVQLQRFLDATKVVVPKC